MKTRKSWLSARQPSRACASEVHSRTGHEDPVGEEDLQLYSIFNLSAGWGGRSAPRPGRFTPWEDPVPTVQDAGCVPGPVWTGAENLAPTGIRSPYRSSRSEQLYRLAHTPVRLHQRVIIIIIRSIVPLGTQVFYEFFPLLSISCQEPQFVPASTRFLDDRSSPAILRSSSLPASLRVPQQGRF